MKDLLPEIKTILQAYDVSDNHIDSILIDIDVLMHSKEFILNGSDEFYTERTKERYGEDCQIIKDVLIKKGYVNAGLSDAFRIWDRYSDAYAAGWLGLDEDDDPDELYLRIKPYIYKNIYLSATQITK